MATRQTTRTRARDTDRNDTCQVLDTALSEGQLSMEEHRQRVRSATAATTLGELQALTTDLQVANAPVSLPTLKRSFTPPRPPKLPDEGGWGLRVATYVLVLVVGIAVGWGVYGNSTSPLDFTTDPGAKSDGIPATVLTPPKRLLSLGGLNGLFNLMRKRFGDTNGYDLTIRSDWADLTRPDPREDRRALEYDYRGGWGDPDPTTTPTNARVVDLAAFDVDAIVGILRGAPETVNIPPAEAKDTTLEITPSEDPLTPTALNLRIRVNGEFGSGYFDVAPDGTLKQVYPAS